MRLFMDISGFKFFYVMLSQLRWRQYLQKYGTSILTVSIKGGVPVVSLIPLRMGSGGSKKGTAEDNRLAAAGAG